jgi:hypothetical protein
MKEFEVIIVKKHTSLDLNVSMSKRVSFSDSWKQKWNVIAISDVKDMTSRSDYNWRKVEPEVC